MHPPRVLAVLATLAATVGLQLASTPAARASFLGDRGMVFVSGKTGSSGPSHIPSLTYANGTRQLVQDYMPKSKAVSLSPTLSAEGGPHILFVQKANAKAPGDIYVMDRYPKGGGLPTPVRLTNTPDDEEQPAGSPSGGKIAYVRNIGGTPQIWTMSLSGKNQEAFTCCNSRGTRGRGTVVVGTEPAWSPNSEWIAYVTTGQTQQIAVASVIGKAPLDATMPSFQVTMNGGTSPNWSPLGERIAYITTSGQLAVLHFDPSGLPQTPVILDTPPSGKTDANPAWSPDAYSVGDHSQGLILFNRGSTLWSIDPNAPSPKATRLHLKGFVAGSNPDWQPQCMNDKPNDTNGAVIRGTAGPDLLCGAKGDDTIYGFGGDDRIFAGEGSDTVFGSDGNDFILGGQGGGKNTIDGGTGNDHIEGGLGSDTITDQGTDSGNDFITAQDGNDTLHVTDGVQGNDRIDGGYGSNTCYVDSPAGGGPPLYDFVGDAENLNGG